MDIQELNKTQLILLTLLITFVVSVATGIVTVSLMQQAPKSVPATINNVIERTIEKINTVPSGNANPATPSKPVTIGEGDGLVSIYPSQDSQTTSNVVLPSAGTPLPKPTALGQGIIISDIGLILVDTSILSDKETYRVTLDKTDLDATLLKKFNNGFAILKIGAKITTPNTGVTSTTPLPPESTPTSTKVDNKL